MNVHFSLSTITIAQEIITKFRSLPADDVRTLFAVSDCLKGAISQPQMF